MADKIALDVTIHEPQQRYTNNDRISGEVVVHVPKELSIERIALKCRCKEIVRVRARPGSASSAHGKPTSPVTGGAPGSAGVGALALSGPGSSGSVSTTTSSSAGGSGSAHQFSESSYKHFSYQRTLYPSTAPLASGSAISLSSPRATASGGASGGTAATGSPQMSWSPRTSSTDSTSSLFIATTGHATEAEFSPSAGALLTVGRHKFPFTLRLPSDRSLPETFKCSNKDGTTGEVVWEIEAVIYRRKVFSVNITASRRFWFVPFTSPGAPVLEGELEPRRQRITPPTQNMRAMSSGPPVSVQWMQRAFSKTRSRVSVGISCDVSVYDAGIQQPPNGSGIQMTLRADHAGYVVLRQITIHLRAATVVFSGGHSSVVENRARLLKLTTDVPVGMAPLSLEELLGGQELVLPHPVYGSFETRFLEHRYTLVAELTLASSRDHQHTSVRSFEFAVSAPPLGAISSSQSEDVDGTHAWRAMARSTQMEGFTFTDRPVAT